MACAEHKNQSLLSMTMTVVSSGCIVSGSTVKGALLLFSSVRVHSYRSIRHPVILPNDVMPGQRLNDLQ